MIGRVYLMSPSQNTDPTWSSILPGVLTEGAIEYALISTSISALTPLLRPYHTGVIVNSVGGAGSGLAYGSSSRAHGIYMRSGHSQLDKNEEFHLKSTTDIGQAHGSGDDLTLGGGGMGRRAITSESGRQRREDEESVESTGSERMIIRTTKDWSIRYEPR